jgi:hypothetical protein
VSSSGTTWRATAERDARRLAAITAAGSVSGLLVGGVGGRLAMMLLAARNPDATGVISDDGFQIGRFTMSGTLNLLLATTLIGVIGGAVYLGLRRLTLGPPWFRTLSLSAGAAIVVGSMLVHTEGVDFTVLKPALLAVALFVAIPFGYVTLLIMLGERVLADDGWFNRAPAGRALIPLVAWIPLVPLVPLLAGGWVVREALRRHASGATMLRHPATSWASRLVLVAVLVAALVDLTGDIATLT